MKIGDSPIPEDDSCFVSRETRARLETYVALVRKWQKTVNLVAPSTIDRLWERHIEDSLQLHRLAKRPQRWIDIGSGAGFPGLVTAICLADSGDGWVELVESNHKKAAFLRTVINETGARARVHATRIEEASLRLDPPDALSARALAPLGTLLRLVHPWVAKRDDLTCWFHKGVGYPEEVAAARGHWSFDLVEHPSRVMDGSVILQIGKIRPR